MPDYAFGSPLLLREGEPPITLERVAIRSGDGGEAVSESFIQQLAFEHPACLPIAEIDVAYERAVPICTELSTPAGPLDALYVTPTGRLVVLEAKLWRNPEARRKVVAQILDYAKELARWSYEDLQRETSRRLGQKGNALFEAVRARYPETDEARFVDGVQQSLRRGRFLLLIVGDGIREGAAAIADFLESAGNLEFTFGLVELALYRHDQAGMLVQPRVVARTVEIKRSIVVLPEGAQLVDGASGAVELEDGSANRAEENTFYTDFWAEFLSELRLDDVSQPLANVGRAQNIYFALPPSRSVAWISAVFMPSAGQVGVYFRAAKGEVSRDVEDFLEAERAEIEGELGEGYVWRSARSADHFSILRWLQLPDPLAADQRQDVKAFFAESANSLVNALRPRMKRYASSEA